MKYDDVGSSTMASPDAPAETHPSRCSSPSSRASSTSGSRRCARCPACGAGRRPPDDGRPADGTLDAVRPAPPVGRPRRLGRRVRRRGCGVVAALRPAHEPLHAAGHRLAAGGADPPGPLRAAVDGSFTLVVESDGARGGVAPAAGARRRRRGPPRSSRPGGSSRSLPLGDSVDRGPDRLRARPGRREGPAPTAMRRAAGRSRARSCTSRARRRPSTTSTPSSRRTSRRASSTSRSRSRS